MKDSDFWLARSRAQEYQGIWLFKIPRRRVFCAILSDYVKDHSQFIMKQKYLYDKFKSKNFHEDDHEKHLGLHCKIAIMRILK